MSKRIILQKATRIEGNANVEIEVEDGRVKSARFLVCDFRGFEKFMQGRRVEHIPAMVSRICGLCSAAHQVASLQAIEDALGVKVPGSVHRLREILVLGEWIGSHALSYFFLTMPDFTGASGGFFELMRTHPDVAQKAYSVRKAGQRIVEILGKRATHPVSLGLGGFLVTPTAGDLHEVRKIALEVKDKALEFIQAGQPALSRAEIAFPPEQQVNLLAYDGGKGRGRFQAFDRQGQVLATFAHDEFSAHISEMATEWSFAKFPYLTRFGFPQGILLVGPLARSFQDTGPLQDPDLSGFGLAQQLRDRGSLTLESLDVCRLLEIFWAAKRILTLLVEVPEVSPIAAVDTQVSGHGFGILEAPRGTLIHNYIVNRGCLERARLLVATQFNNAYINLLIHDLAEKHLEGDRLSPKGEWLIGRCIRLFDPCLSCATH